MPTILAAGALLGIPAAAVASSAQSRHGSAAHAKLVPFTFRTDFSPGSTYAYLQYGIDKGYYRQQGLDFKLEMGNGSVETASDVGSGGADAGDVSSSVVALAIGQGTPIVAVGGWKAKYEFGIFVPKNSGITSIRGLKGKTIAVGSGTQESEIFPGVLKLAGLSTSQVHILSVASADELTPYEDGQADAVAVSLSFAGPLIQPKRASNFLSLASAGWDIPDYSYVVNKSYLAKHPTVVAKFLTATYESLAGAFAHPVAASQDLVKAYPTLTVPQTLSGFKLDRQFLCSTIMQKKHEPIGYQNPADWAAGLKVMRKYLALPAKVKVKQVITDAFFEPPYSVSKQTC